MSVPDHYRQLGIPPSASRREIRAAYRRHLLRYHPDTNGGRRTEESKLRQVLEAGRVLGDPELRAAYDQRILGAGNSACALKAAQPPLPLNLTESLKQLGAGILRRWTILHARFFTAEKAALSHRAYRKRPQHTSLAFSDCLATAMEGKHKSCYEFHSDGIWRRKKPGTGNSRHQRTRLWTLLILILEVWRE